LRGVLGTAYSCQLNFGSLVSRAHRGGEARSDLVRLRGKRMVASVEVENGTQLAEGLVKSLTGGDVIAARTLYQPEIEFRPTCKFFLAANHRPTVSDDDDALWRRIVVVPFTNAVPDGKRDPAVKAQLRDPAVGGPAILAWMVRGLLDYRVNGFRVPEVVRKATQAYRADMDPIDNFWTECCVPDPAAWTPTRRLCAAYERWTDEQRERPIAKKVFWTRLAARGCKPEKREHTRGWLGVKLTDPDTDDDGVTFVRGTFHAKKETQA